MEHANISCCLTVDDFVDFSDDEDVNKGSLSKDEDSDFVFDEGEESASDWEMESKKSSHKKVYRLNYKT
jgi:hypothetical protein